MINRLIHNNNNKLFEIRITPLMQKITFREPEF
jgi:hypothetical protein